jgi:hypothetical protein
VGSANFWGALLGGTTMPITALHWRIGRILTAIITTSQRKSQEKEKREQQKRIRETVRLVRELEAKDPRLRRQAQKSGRGPA